MKLPAKMQKAIKLIEESFDVKFTGKTFDDASKFIGEWLPKLKEVDFREKKKPSEKQLKGIDLIEKWLGIIFEGSSMKDASDFLELHLDDALKEIERSKKDGSRSSSRNNKRTYSED